MLWKHHRKIYREIGRLDDGQIVLQEVDGAACIVAPAVGCTPATQDDIENSFAPRLAEVIFYGLSLGLSKEAIAALTTVQIEITEPPVPE